MAPPSEPVSPAIEVHRLRKDLRSTVYWISGILFVPLVISLIVRLANPRSGTSLRGLIGFLAVWAFGTALALLRLRLARFEILPDGFRYVSLFRDSRFSYDEIAGFRAQVSRYGGRSPEAIGILYDTAGRRRLRLSAYLERPNAVRDWMRKHFPDLDSEDAAQEREVLEGLKTTAPSTLGLLRLAATALEVGAVGLSALLILASPTIGAYKPLGRGLVVVLFAIPWIALSLRARYGRLISVSRTPYKSRFPRLEASLLLPPMAGWALAFVVPPVSWRDAFVLSLVPGALLFLAMWRLAHPLVANRLVAALSLLLAAGYGYGLICFSNAAYDDGDVERRPVIVRQRYVRRGRATLVVAERTAPEQTRSLAVPRFVEEAMPPDTPAVLLVKPGGLGIPWIVGIVPDR